MGWTEAVGHLEILVADPSSMLTSAVQGWAYPISREVAVLMDLYDLEHAKAGPKKKFSYPRPFKTKNADVQRFGNTGGRSRAQVVEILNGLGHNLTA